MKVILTKDVAGTGKAGEVKDVADGYARNYLLPRKLAVPASASALKGVEQRKAAESQKVAKEEAAARDLAERLTAAPVVVTAKVGDQGRLYGSITSADIAEQLTRMLGQPFDRRMIQLDEPIRQLGTFDVPVRLHRAVSTKLKVDVQAAK
ncbi:MAG: 50S ribosomal protein L9 [Chloroflexota bacterium]|nr:50S ribosomal protein L9 [Chloroflexota bacterium]